MQNYKHISIPVISEEIQIITENGFINIYIGTSNKEALKAIEDKIIKECEKYHNPVFEIMYDFRVKTEFAERLWNEEHLGRFHVIEVMTYTNKAVNKNVNLVAGEVTGFEKIYWARIKQQ